MLDRYAAMCRPVLDVFGQTGHWSLMQVEYSTDLVFRSPTTPGPLYERLIRQSGLSVKAEQIATFLGRQVTPQLALELGSQFSTGIEGTCIKHRFGSASITMYDKFGCVLRIETTTNDVSFFKRHRKVEHRSGPPSSRAIAFQNWARSLERKASFHPARLNFPRRDPLDPSVCIAFSAMWRRIARFSGPWPRRVRS